MKLKATKPDRTEQRKPRAEVRKTTRLMESKSYSKGCAFSKQARKGASTTTRIVSSRQFARCQELRAARKVSQQLAASLILVVAAPEDWSGDIH